MNRRRFLAWLGAPAALAVGASVRAQTPGDTARAADPLARPDWAGRPRAEVRIMDNDPIVKVIERKLGCTCPCGLDIYTCRTTDFTCTYSPALHREVIALLEAGRTPDQVVDDFVAKYGEQILMAPRAAGFGVLGYVLPGAAILGAGTLLAWVLLRRDRVADAPAPPGLTGAPPPEPGGSPDELARLERAVRELDQ